MLLPGGLQDQDPVVIGPLFLHLPGAEVLREDKGVIRVRLQPLLLPPCTQNRGPRTCLPMLKWGGGLPSARHLISTRSPSFSIPSGSTSSHTLSAGSAQAKGAALSPRASRTQPHSDGSVLTENRDSDLPRFLHVVPTGQPIAELAVKLGIFVLLGQLCLQNAPQGVQTTRLHDLGRLDVDPWAGRKGRRARPQLRLQPHPMISWVSGMAGEPL